MEENNLENKEGNTSIQSTKTNNSTLQITSAIIVAGMLIAGAILLKGNTVATTEGTQSGNNQLENITLSPIGPEDRVLGDQQAKLTLVLYEDFQCPYCGKFFNESEKPIRESYVNTGILQLVYRDFSFLGIESARSAEAARCAGDQNKFWEYHDYLYTHQNGENKGAFSDKHLKEFAQVLGLDQNTFDQCFDNSKYAQKVSDSNVEARGAGVVGTPKGFIITKKDISEKVKSEIIKSIVLPPNSPPAVSFFTTKNIVSLNGALPYNMVKTVIDILLKYQ